MMTMMMTMVMINNKSEKMACKSNSTATES